MSEFIYARPKTLAPQIDTCEIEDNELVISQVDGTVQRIALEQITANWILETYTNPQIDYLLRQDVNTRLLSEPDLALCPLTKNSLAALIGIVMLLTASIFGFSKFKGISAIKDSFLASCLVTLAALTILQLWKLAGMDALKKSAYEESTKELQALLRQEKTGVDKIVSTVGKERLNGAATLFFYDAYVEWALKEPEIRIEYVYVYGGDG